MLKGEGWVPYGGEMSEQRSYHRVAERLQAAFGDAPSGAVLLGSGGGPLVSRWEGVVPAQPYGVLGLPSPTVPGHAGTVAVMRSSASGERLVVLSGRIHRYEGHSNETLLLPVRALRAWGVSRIVLTSAVGSLRRTVAPGALVHIDDHINLAENPLVGNHAPLGPRFPDLSRAYSPRLGALLQATAAAQGVTLHRGVYAMMSGPSYETPAEIRALERLGGDVVGMSMPPEVVGAVQAGLEVLGVGIVSNFAAGLSEEHLSHDEVLEIVGSAVARLGGLLDGVIAQW